MKVTRKRSNFAQKVLFRLANLPDRSAKKLRVFVKNNNNSSAIFSDLGALIGKIVYALKFVMNVSSSS